MKSCEVSDDRLVIKNETHKGMYYIYSKGYTLNTLERVYLLTNPNNPQSDTSYSNYLLPNDITTVNNNVTWEGYVKNSPGEKINFYFFSIDTLKKYSWEEIMIRENYSCRLSYSIEDLEAMDWEIVYPAEECFP
jgi:predicted AlkP superfamily pyrophosphatase or phosphodiesterase